MKDIIIIDDAFSNTAFSRLQQKVLGPQLQWSYNRKVYADDSTKANEYLHGWSHILAEGGHSKNEYVYGLFEGCFLNCIDNLGYEVTDINRARLILNTISDKPYITDAHVDYDVPHYTALLYINDSDGNTVIYNERYDNTDVSSRELSKDLKFTVKQEIEPKANRLVIFDGLHYHCGTTPSKCHRRILLNINFRVKV